VPIIWPIHHNTGGEVITTTVRDENHQVSRVDARACGSHDVRMCCDERDNAVPAGQGRRLIVEWMVSL